MKPTPHFVVGNLALKCFFFLHLGANNTTKQGITGQYIQSLQTVVDKERDSGASFLGRDTGALQAGPGSLLLPAAENSSATQQHTTQHGEPLCLCPRTPRRGTAPCLRRFEIHYMLAI
ncbi:hypothetical protein Y032_0310g2097 [Ancylostoma ceylanicum]|uniref:Uncharacterized protein n=1 Tax=Ancylostoma ceylanicum TaxID=53326 RepID=A0A016S3E2_9BILA|nr:hypothetical protein Y032_0310g2097 [Ancylostoma ceylanicum]